MLEHMLPNKMLDDFYVDGLGFYAYNRHLARMVKQLAHRYPKMNLIEIGAGTGGATSVVLDMLESAYSSYTYTDISSGFFENAAARFSSQSDKMVFKTLDVEKPPVNQGYKSGVYDASNSPQPVREMMLMNMRNRLSLRPTSYMQHLTCRTPLSTFALF